MDKYQGPVILVTLGLLVGAAASETFLKVQWSPGLLALIGVPLAAVFADKAAKAIKQQTEKQTEKQLGEGRRTYADDERGGK